MTEKTFSKHLIGKTVVSKTGKKFGQVADLIFEIRTGELIYFTLGDATPHIEKLNLEKSKDGELLVPFSSVMAVGDFVVISEEDIV